MLNLIRRSMETSSLSDQAQGVPTGGRKTKFEVQSLQEGAMNIAALTLQLMEDYMTRKYRLRMYNILQYYSMPSRKKSGKKQFKYIEIENAKLTNNKIGTKKIQIVGGPSEVVPGEQLQSPQFLGADQAALPPEEQKVEAIVLDRDYLMHREFDLDVRMIPNASVKDSEIDRKNKNIQYFQLTRQDPLFNPVDGAKDLAEAFDKPESVVVEPQQQGPSPQEVTNQGVGPRNPEFAPPAPSTEKSLEQF